MQQMRKSNQLGNLCTSLIDLTELKDEKHFAKIQTLNDPLET